MVEDPLLLTELQTFTMSETQACLQSGPNSETHNLGSRALPCYRPGQALKDLKGSHSQVNATILPGICSHPGGLMLSY